ncbi:MAG: hypothetical protein ABI478_07250 [Propionivibrio sp.]
MASISLHIVYAAQLHQREKRSEITALQRRKNKFIALQHRGIDRRISPAAKEKPPAAT